MKRTLLTFLLAASIIASSCANIFGRLPLVADVQRSIVQLVYQIDAETAYGCTGFVVNSSKGLALTAKHCLPPGDQPLVVDGDVTEVVKENGTLALIKVKPMSKPPLAIRTKPLIPAETVVALGYGGGQFIALTRTIAATFIMQGVPGHVALDGPLVHGMSGGPIVDLDRKVVGINQGVYFNQIGVGCGQEEIAAFLK